jgi:hypothetical protein
VSYGVDPVVQYRQAASYRSSQHANMISTTGAGGIPIVESRSTALCALKDENHL